jgi:hypothetical protein
MKLSLNYKVKGIIYTIGFSDDLRSIKSGVVILNTRKNTLYGFCDNLMAKNE